MLAERFLCSVRFKHRRSHFHRIIAYICGDEADREFELDSIELSLGWSGDISGKLEFSDPSDKVGNELDDLGAVGNDKINQRHNCADQRAKRKSEMGRCIKVILLV